MSANDPQAIGRHFGPNWFASVMGTGIIANAAIGLPVVGPSLTGFGFVVWSLASLMLITLLVVLLLQALLKPHVYRHHFDDPVMSQFWGAPPMALMTIAGGTLLFGHHVFSEPVVLAIAWTLWLVGTVSGFVVAIVVPFRLFTHHRVRPDAAFGGWLMPVVSPMVSAAIGAMLIPHASGLVLQQTMLYLCYALFGVSLVGALIIITLIWSRLAHYGTSGGARVPTLWIVLGPLGQSVTAAGALGLVALNIVDQPLAGSLNAMATLYGIPVWGFAFYWSFMAALLTLRAFRKKMPFALTWWAFTFPVGTCVTGTTQIALHTGLPLFEWAAVLLFVGLLCAWLTAAIGTLRGFRGHQVLHAPARAPEVASRKNLDDS